MCMRLPDCMMPDGADPCCGYQDMKFERDHTLAAVRQIFGAKSAAAIDELVVTAREARNAARQSNVAAADKPATDLFAQPTE